MIDAGTALGALLIALGAKLWGVDGEFFALASVVVGVALGLAMGKVSPSSPGP